MFHSLLNESILNVESYPVIKKLKDIHNDLTLEFVSQCI